MGIDQRSTKKVTVKALWIGSILLIIMAAGLLLVVDWMKPVSLFWGLGLMLGNLVIWYGLYRKISQNADNIGLWAILLALKFLFLGGLIIILPKWLDLHLMSFGAGIFIVAISGIFASVWLAK